MASGQIEPLQMTVIFRRNGAHMKMKNILRFLIFIIDEVKMEREIKYLIFFYFCKEIGFYSYI